MSEGAPAEPSATIRALLVKVGSFEPASRLGRGALWSVLAGASTQVLAFVASVVVARLLGGQLFGELAIIRSTALAFATFAAFGIGLTATKLVAETRFAAPRRTGRIIPLAVGASVLSGGAAACLVFFLSPVLATRVLDTAHLADLIRVGSLLLLFTTVSFAQTGVLAGFEAFKELAVVNTLAGAASIAAVVTGTWFGGLEGAVWGTVVGIAVHCALNHRAILRQSRAHAICLEYAACVGEWRAATAVTLPIGLGNLLTAPSMWICHVLLVGQPGGYVHMAVLNVATQWRSAVLFIPERLCQVALPMLSSLMAEGRASRFRRALMVHLILVGGVSLGLAVPLVLMSRWIMRLYGPDFVSGSDVICLLAASGVLLALSLVLERTLVSLGRVWARLVTQLFWTAVLLGLGALFVLRGGGATGLALAVVVACACQTVLSALLVWWTVRRLQGSAGAGGGDRDP